MSRSFFFLLIVPSFAQMPPSLCDFQMLIRWEKEEKHVFGAEIIP